MQPHTYKSELMQNILDPSMSKKVTRSCYNSFLRWFSEPSTWLSKLELLKCICVRQYVLYLIGLCSVGSMGSPRHHTPSHYCWTLSLRLVHSLCDLVNHDHVRMA